MFTQGIAVATVARQELVRNLGITVAIMSPIPKNQDYRWCEAGIESVLGSGALDTTITRIGYHDQADWIPFGNKIKDNTISFDIDYSLIELRYPYITNILGLYLIQVYQFSEDNLRKLSSILDVSLTKRVEASKIPESAKK